MAIGLRILLTWMVILAPWVALLTLSLEEGKVEVFQALMLGVTVQ